MSAFVFLISAVVLVPIGWHGIDALAHALFGIDAQRGSRFLGLVLAFLISAILAKAAKFANDAPASSWARQAIGWFYRALVFVPIVGGAFWLLWRSYGAVTGGRALFDDWLGIGLLFVLLMAVTSIFMPWAKYALGRSLKPLLDLVRVSKFGQGGSAAFGGILDDWAARYRPGSILLGASLYDHRWKVGHSDDRGFLTIASSRSGKGRSAIIPNLILWPGSALVIDPKGTNAAVTAKRRAQLGQTVYVVDPFGITPFADDARAGFNPLGAIDFKSNQVTEDIRLIADALVVSDGAQESHWNEAAQTIIAGLIAHLLASGKGTTLNDLRRVTKQGNAALDALFGDMLHDHSAGGLPAAAAALVTNAGPNERGSFYTTVMRNLSWLDSVAMQKALSKSDFDLGDLKRKAMTVYIVLPPDMLSQHKRFMRLFVTGAINAISQGERGRHKVLFLLDEFYSLGNIALIEKAAGLLSGYGMKLWPIVQNLTQLRQLYPDNWETFFANAGAVQVFSVNDRATAEYLTARLGSRVMHAKAGQQVLRTVAALREVEELGRDVSRERLRQIIYRSGDDPLVLRRMQYDKDFPASDFAPDPDYAGAPKRSWSDRLKPAVTWFRQIFSGWSLPKIDFGRVLAMAGPSAASLETKTMTKEEIKKSVDQTMGRSLPPRFEMPEFMKDIPAKPPPEKAASVEPVPDDAGLSFEELIAAPVAATKHAIFERYQLLQEKAGGDETLLSRASIWLTGEYRNNLTGPDPFAQEEGRKDLPKWSEKGNPWAGRKLSDDELRRKRGDEDE